VTSTTGTKFEALQGGVNVQLDSDQLPGAAVTREFNRAFAETINFDKNEIFYSIHTMTDDINFAIGTGLSDQSSTARLRITADGIHAITFSGLSWDFLYGIQNGEVLEAGTYELYMIYTNGSVVVNVPGTTQQSSGLTQLSAPPNFAAAADGENAIDLTWDDVANETEYQIEKSSTGTGGWLLLSNPAANAVSDTDTGLTQGETVYYRLKALGDGVTYADSPYSTAVGTTSSSGDVTAPTFVWLPANTDTGWSVNRSITITANEALRNDNGTEITDANVATRLVLKETNSVGADIPFTATIDVTKKIIKIFPTIMYGGTQLVYVAIDNVEDASGNEITLQSITFTTSDYTTFFEIGSDFLHFGDILETLWSAQDTNFEIEVDIQNYLMSGLHMLVAKGHDLSDQRSWYLATNGADVLFAWFNLTGISSRVVQWVGALDGTQRLVELEYNGAIDTNNGLDRVTLKIDGATAGSKSFFATPGGALFDPANSTAELVVGAWRNGASTFYSGEMKDFKIRSGSGSVTEIHVPILITGEDTSGNNRDGIWQ
jgi:hypothetical protein